jgi:hypothetical protein
MQYASIFRGVLAIVATLVVLLAAAGCVNDQPLLSADHPAALLDGGVYVGSGHEEDAPTTTNTTAAVDTVGRGPGTIGSGH